MKRTLRLGLTSLYVLAGGAVLAFGSVPTPAAAAPALVCVHSECRATCRDLGWDTGRCNTTGDCVCSYYMCGGQIC